VHFAAFVAVHSTQAPVAEQAGAAALHSSSAAQARQVIVVRLHTGVVPPHWALLVQATHVPMGTLQTGVAPWHRLAFVAEHWPHTPLGWQAGAEGVQSPSRAQPRQVCVPASQIGRELPQSALLRQPTHTPATMSHRGVAPVHRLVFVAVHWVHAPFAWQAGVAPPHSASPAHARQACDALSHTGLVPPQLALVVHDTHVPGPTSQAGVGLTHAVALLAEHWPQAPLAWQAGVAPPHSASRPQARHWWVAPSQTGVVPPQSAPVTQGTHVPDDRRHTGVASMQRVALVAEHWPQAPPGWQAGVRPPHSLSPAQARHWWKAASQTGVAPEQSASARQLTHVPAVVRQTGVAPWQADVLPSEHWPQAPVG
jgi:hypothetical protein